MCRVAMATASSALVLVEVTDGPLTSYTVALPFNSPLCRRTSVVKAFVSLRLTTFTMRVLEASFQTAVASRYGMSLKILLLHFSQSTDTSSDVPWELFE